MRNWNSSSKSIQFVDGLKNTKFDEDETIDNHVEL